MNETDKGLLTIALLFSLSFSAAQEKAHLEIDSPFASFVEEDFPFFTQTVDARKFSDAPEPNNLTPRGIIVKAGNGYFGCFDPDLLRWSLLWKESKEGEYLTMDGMGPGSYRLPNRKSSAGQEELPRPIGTAVAMNPLRPGVVAGFKLLDDPRERGAAEEVELGLGPIPATMGRFQGLRLVGDGVQIEYTISGILIKERLSSEDGKLLREIEIAAREEPLIFMWGGGEDGWAIRSPSTTTTSAFFQIDENGHASSGDHEPFPTTKPTPLRWKETVKTGPPIAPEKDAPWVFDNLPIPVPNPWKRNVRLADLEFFPDGRAALVTFDGDVWIVSGLESDNGAVWSRFASGLHEPQSLCLVQNVIHVFDRNGIMRLHDTDNNGEADWYENFSNIVPQTAETREFPMDMIATKDGDFYLAKGGQIGSTIGKVNGTVVKVSGDGLSYEIISTGLRQPYLGYDRENDILTSSDQQGNWKPATPIYRIERGRYFGFMPEKFKDKVPQPAPINSPEVWIPHFINQSGASQVWLKENSRMGTLNGSLIHIGYNRPEIFKIYLNESGQQGAVVPLLSGFPSGILNGRINPIDGFLYLCGFEIWGTSGSQISGLFRVRPGSAPSWTPRQIRAEKRGVLIEFEHPISKDLAIELSRYSVDRWNYRQTHEYGSGNFKLDGEPGQESVPVSSVEVSNDGRSLFFGLPGMAPSHSLRLTYRLPVPDSVQVETAYLTIHSLEEMDLTALGFASNEVDLTKKSGPAAGDIFVEPTAERGREVSVRYGCIACHATGDSAAPAPQVSGAAGAQMAVGPPWIGLWNAARTFTDGSAIKNADETYLRESILDPPRRVAVGYETEKTGVGMPSYLGVLKDNEIDSILMYIRSLPKK